MPSLRARSTTMCLEAVCLVAISLLLSTLLPAQGASGRVLGRVSDPSGAVLAAAKITLTNEATGISRDALTNDSGDYSFVDVAPGTYTVQFELTGFKRNVQKSVIVDVNQVVTLNSTLQIGGSQETIEVTSEAPQVDTTSTQLGAVINDRSVNELPLNTRDTYQFLQLQPGVQAQLGSSGSLFAGSDDPGSVSVNGGRTRANNFSVNGGDANDQFVNTPTIQPTPDAVEEFRVITNTFDAEYGRNSGSVVNVITKSGGNTFHGNIYEYFRNTILDSRGYAEPTVPQLNQNQFGGTFGGPVKKDRTFFFLSYEGRRIRDGQVGQLVNVPTGQPASASGAASGEFGGDFTAAGGFPAPTSTSSGAGGISSSDAMLYQVLNGRSANGVTCPSAITTEQTQAGAPPTAPAPGVSWSTLFPGGVIPLACQDPVAANLLQLYVPTANSGTNQYQAIPVGTDNEDQFTARFDHKINDHQNFTAYYYFDDQRILLPYNTFEEAGATVPGFGNYNNERFQQWNFTHTWTINNAVVNEAHFTYMREGELGFLKSQSTGAVTSSCTGAAAQYCFTGLSDSTFIQNNFPQTPKLGITPGLSSNLTGVPFIDISGGAEIGNNWEGFLPQVGNSFQWSDGLTWVKGNHTFKFGVDVRRMRFDQYYYFDLNGDYTLDNTGPNSIIPGDGDNYAEFLLGMADVYVQGSGQREDIRGTAAYPFAQDSWKIKPNLTLNYGLRWEYSPPPVDISGHVETFRPGQNSTGYPCGINTSGPGASLSYWQSTFATYGQSGPINCATTGTEPTGLVVPGDPGVPAGMTSTYYKSFAPRLGIAYSPNFTDGPLARLFGSSGKTSIRAGWGLFYNPIEELVMAQFGAEPPFGGSSSLSDTFFNTPFVSQLNPANGIPTPNPFGGIITPTKGAPTDLSLFRPILLYGEFGPHLRSQYTTQYNLTIQRELSNSMMFQIGYVGSQGHRLLATHDLNPSNPQSCLDMSNISQYYANQAPTPANQALAAAYGCGPTVEDSDWILPANSIPSGYTLHMPYGSVPQYGSGNPALNLVGLRPYSSPNCNPALPANTAGTGCPVDGTPIFTDIFAEDTIANSNYNALEMMLQKRFSRGLQFQAAYTYSKSIDDGSTFEESLDPFNYRASRGLSLFNSKQRFVVSYDWELPIRKYSGFAGKVLDDWEVSGITQFQSGFPIRLNTEDDTELINSLFFLGTEAPSLVGPLQIENPKKTGGFYLNYNNFQDPPLGQFNNGTQRTLCCGPGLADWDFSVHKKISLSETKYLQFRAEIFNVFNHTNYSNPDGGFSDGSTEFGKITTAGDPRLLQFALKFFF
jgi:Carboxypeptidase regulatory-like domain